ncbi:MAG: domain S-box protein [Gammaproteobacteria bacterium]|nr:domain S-box protein [Gammaproteobacteria bacterium]
MQRLREDGEYVLLRDRRDGYPGLDDLSGGLDPANATSVLVLVPVSEHPSPRTLRRLEHEFSLASDLDPRWAARPLALTRREGRNVLLLEDPGGEPLERRIGQRCELAEFLSLAIAITNAVAQAHAQGLIHKDIKPANILIDAGDRVFLTGFGSASLSPREGQVLQPPEVLSGTLPYMAPEQTGRMNRSIDSRSDLYSLGVTLFELLTGRLPFIASDPLDWIHCHIALRPASPVEYRSLLPEPVAQMLLRLLAKSAEERYQTAGGLEADWRHCLEQWRRYGRIEAFALGRQDIPDRLVAPETLYGREREVAALRAAYQEVGALGVPVLMLITGYAGVGKSALVHEFHRELAQARCWFAPGKCDPYQEVPYTTLAKALSNLVRELLGHPGSEITAWRERLLQALGSNGDLVIQLIPELALIIGPQPLAPEVPPQDVLNRLRRVVRRFLGVFATAEHPLVLFLDDLQWLDAATLSLLEYLLAEPEVRHILVIGAYRDHEVDASHPLAVALRALELRGAKVRQLALDPLDRANVERLVSATLHCPRERAAELAALVHLKTHGNPFFATQFLTNLAQEGLLQSSGAGTGWLWDLARIRAKGFTDNVAHLLVVQLGRLSEESSAVLQRLACMGGEADVAALMKVLDVSEPGVHQAFGEAVLAGLVIRVEGSYRLLHDRVQEAAYSLIPERERSTLHLHIGRALWLRMTSEETAEHVFAIVNQLNRGRDLIPDRQERRALAELNLLAGKRALESSASSAALSYAIAGSDLLSEDRWEQCHDLAFALEFHRGECEFLTGALAEGEARLAALAARARDPILGAEVARLRETIHETLGRVDRSVEVCLEYLGQHGIALRPTPTEGDVQEEYTCLWRQLGTRTVEELVDLPVMADPHQRANLDVLASVLAPAFLTDNANLLRLVVGRMANLSLQYGNCDGSLLAYSYLNFIVGAELGDYGMGFRFGKLAMALLEKGMHRFKPRVELMFGATVVPWTQPMRTGLTWLRRCVESAQEAGDLMFACYANFMLIPYRLCLGESLEELQREAERALEDARKLHIFMVDLITPQVAFLHALRGFTAEISSFAAASFDEAAYEKRLGEDPGLDDRVCWYWLRKLQACFLAEDYAAAIEAGSRTRAHPWRTSTQFYICSDYHFYMALAHAAQFDRVSPSERREHCDAVTAHARSLAVLAANSVENFGSRAHLVAAELARIEARDPEAHRLYEHAISAARVHGYVHDEAVALEVASRFYASRDLDTAAFEFLRRARLYYEQWGAIGKVRLLERRYPKLREHPTMAFTTPAAGASAWELDASSVIKAAQAISSEIVLGNLIQILLTLAVKQAGAERGLLILVHDGLPRLEAEARTDQGNTDGSTVAVTVKQAELTAGELPDTILQYVMRTQESVILDDATRSQSFSADDYLRLRGPKSVLCKPLTRQGRLIGVLYLENKMAAGVFTAERMSILDVLAAQAAISLENAYLYSDLRERESRIRRLIDSNVVGIFFWTMSGAITEANDEFLRLAGYSRDALLRGELTWQTMTPSEYHELDRQSIEQLRAGGIATQQERDLLRGDGTRVPVLMGGTLLEGSQEQGVSFVLDITERRQAELERGARRVAEAASRAKSEFLATMSHELRTPLNAVLGYAQILARDTTLTARQRDRLTVIHQSGEHLLTLINEALDVAKIEAGKLGLEPSVVALATFLATIREIILIKAQEKGLDLIWNVAPDLPQAIYTDERRLRQVLLNLLANAVKFTDHGQVRLSITPAGPARLRFRVQDTGIGMSADQLQRLFQPFEQVGEERRRTGGTGLGLAISRSLVRLMGADIQVESELGEGSTFWFELDLPVVNVEPLSSGPRDNSGVSG